MIGLSLTKVNETSINNLNYSLKNFFAVTLAGSGKWWGIVVQWVEVFYQISKATISYAGEYLAGFKDLTYWPQIRHVVVK